MTKEELVVNNLRLVRVVMKRYYNTTFDEDLFQIGCIGLVEAAKVFDESRGIKFSTLAVKAIANELFNSSRKKRLLTISLEEPLNDDMSVILADTIADKDNLFNCVDTRLVIEKAFKNLSPRKKEVIEKYFTIKNQKEVAKLYGITQAQVSRIINEFRDNLIKLL